MDYFNAVLSDKFIDKYTTILKKEYDQKNPKHKQIAVEAA
jgi:hypothetical protein